ncbi:MAG: hypothetical protein WC596_01775 [Candidatus Shapirobacteria bacterium]
MSIFSNLREKEAKLRFTGQIDYYDQSIRFGSRRIPREILEGTPMGKMFNFMEIQAEIAREPLKTRHSDATARQNINSLRQNAEEVCRSTTKNRDWLETTKGWLLEWEERNLVVDVPEVREMAEVEIE